MLVHSNSHHTVVMGLSKRKFDTNLEIYASRKKFNLIKWEVDEFRIVYASIYFQIKMVLGACCCVHKIVLFVGKNVCPILLIIYSILTIQVMMIDFDVEKSILDADLKETLIRTSGILIVKISYM